MFYLLYAYSVDVVEVAPPGATEDHRSCWDMQTQDYHFCCICLLVLSVQQLWNIFSTRLPVHLLRQVYVFVFLSFLFRVCFLFVWWKVLEGSFGARRVLFGSILETFECHFGDFWEVRWMFENVRFTMVNTPFGGSGGFWFMTFSCCFFVSISWAFFIDFYGFCWVSRSP